MKTNRPKARKHHTCSFCNLPIPAGTIYYTDRITPWDHPDNEHYFTIKAHPHCWDFWRSEYGETQEWIFPGGGGREFRAELSIAVTRRLFTAIVKAMDQRTTTETTAT